MHKPYFCPVNGWDCPYWRKDGTCKLGREEAIKNCEDAMAMEHALNDDDPNTIYIFGGA